jgi:hypothetical protein
VAAIFPGRFRSFNVALKFFIFYYFFIRKTGSAVCRNINKKKNSRIPAKMKQQEGAGVGKVIGLCAGRTMKACKSLRSKF